jgi:hypothetical protein
MERIPMTDKPNPPECIACGTDYPTQRAALGYNTCLDCGDFAARTERLTWTIVCTPKGHYTRITSKEELKCLNQKPR